MLAVLQGLHDHLLEIKAMSDESIDLLFDELLEAIWQVLNSADNTGCSGDLTVVSAEALDRLREAVEKDVDNG
jgi:hypothetical protein